MTTTDDLLKEAESALEPFAKRADDIGEREWGMMSAHIEDFRRARDFLSRLSQHRASTAAVALLTKATAAMVDAACEAWPYTSGGSYRMTMERALNAALAAAPKPAAETDHKIADVVSRADRLAAQVKALREALVPLARCSMREDEEWSRMTMRRSDISRAVSVLAETNPNQKEGSNG